MPRQRFPSALVTCIYTLARALLAASGAVAESTSLVALRQGALCATTFYISGAMGGLSDDERQPLGGGKAPHGCGPSMFRVVLIESMICLLWAILEIVNAILKLLELIYRPFGACAGLLKPNDPPKHVVIVGASFGGLAAQRQLSGRRDVKVTLIDFKSYFEYTPGVPPSPRAVPRPE